MMSVASLSAAAPAAIVTSSTALSVAVTCAARPPPLSLSPTIAQLAPGFAQVAPGFAQWRRAYAGQFRVSRRPGCTGSPRVRPRRAGEGDEAGRGGGGAAAPVRSGAPEI